MLPKRRWKTLRIKQLILENFRPFCGRHKIDMTTKEGRSIILIKALNDVGKTSLFKGVLWCLYGGKSRKETKMHVNRSACVKGDGRTSVKLTFSHDGRIYEFVRSVNFRKAPRGVLAQWAQGFPQALIARDVSYLRSQVSPVRKPTLMPIHLNKNTVIARARLITLFNTNLPPKPRENLSARRKIPSRKTFRRIDIKTQAAFSC